MGSENRTRDDATSRPPQLPSRLSPSAVAIECTGHSIADCGLRNADWTITECGLDDYGLDDCGLRIGRLRIAECRLDGLRMADRESATWCMPHLVNFQSA